MSKRPRLLSSCLVLFALALAAAGPALAEEPLAVAAPAAVDVRERDANADRVILSPTAETHPAGTFFFSDYELLLLQAGYAFTDRLQVSVTGLPPMFQDQPYLFDVTAKLNVYRGDRLRAALQLSGDTLTSSSLGIKTLYGVRLGATGQLCFDPGCFSSLSLGAGTLINDRSNKEVPVYLSAGLTLRVTELVKVLIEPAYGVAVGRDGVDGASGFLLNYGLRLSGKQFGFDLSFMRPIGSDSDGFLLGLPVVSFTYRS